MKKILIAGATGVTGTALVRHFAAQREWSVMSTARREPWIATDGVTHVCADLLDTAGCREAFASMRDVSHIVYAALNENEADIVKGWGEPEQAHKNVTMLANLLDPFVSAQGNAFRHITLIHGMKAYGSHRPDRKASLPYKETDPTFEELNFYHLQHEYVREQAEGADWDWTVLRPNGTIGVAVGGNLNWSLVLGVFAALCAEAGEDLPMPPGETALTEITDADILAEACDWAATNPVARNEVYNITNGDILAMHDVYSVLAAEYGLRLKAPAPFVLSKELARLAPLWPEMVRRHQLDAPTDLSSLLGATPQVVDVWGEALPPERKLLSGLSSTIKLRQAGFGACADSTETFAKYIRRYRQLKILP